MNNCLESVFNTSNIKLLLGRFPTQRFLTEGVIKFAHDEGIIELISSMQCFIIEEILTEIRQKLGYKLQDRTRLRMAKVILDLLKECGYIKSVNGYYRWNGDSTDKMKLHSGERKEIRTIFKGQVKFFEECINYAAKFLRGSPPLYNFHNNSASIWEDFLGNVEFEFARSFLMKILFLEKSHKCKALVLCCGPGFDILQMQHEFPEIRVTALDFTDIFYEKALKRALNTGNTEWIDNKLWKGFGAPLPFDDETFDFVLFTCADPYISGELRENFYRDIFRILRHKGSLGILTNSYPDPEGKYVKNIWVRRGVLCHDFLESVCKGWHGFHDAGESARLFERICFNTTTLMLNASVWTLEKP